MNKNIKGVFPKWRFLEFKGNGDWERKKLGEMAFIVNDKIAIEKLSAETYISTENMLPNFAGVSTASQLPQTGNFTKFKADDILVSNIRPYLKKVWRSNKTGGASNDVIVFRSNSDVDSNFLEFILKNELFINYVMKNVKGLKMPRGDKESMLIYPVYIPPYPTFSEQQKIVDCLSSIDELISAEEKKLSLLNDYKKGWMQKLFPAEGKTVPEWRFPEFRDCGEWKKRTLGEVCSYWNGSSHESKVTENGKYYLITLNSVDIDGNLKYEMKKISYTDYSLKKDDLIMVLSDIAHGNFLGLTAIIPNDRYVLNQRMAGLRIKEESLANSFFIRAYVNHNQKYFKANGQGSSQLNLSKSSVTCFSVLLPLIKEQEKIADFLSGIDDLISKQTSKIESLKCHKKALMQGLFPTVEEILK